MFTLESWKYSSREYYNNKFYTNNDDSHKIDHVDKVYLEMLRLNKKLNLDLNENIIFLTAYTHDLFTSIDRKNHHIIARGYVNGSCDAYLDMFEQTDLKLIGDAVYEHRASGLDKYTNDYSRILRLADKGAPDIDNVILRAYLYRKNEYAEVSSECADEILEHLIEKFGRDGYAFKSVDYRTIYSELLTDFWNKLDTIGVDEIITRIKQLIKNKEEL